MRYKYKNVKHVTIHGVSPGGIIETDEKLIGGSFELINEKKEKNKSKEINTDESIGDMI